jgi:hypothetical protein
VTCQDDGEWNVLEVHDPLAEDLTRLIETWGLATLIHGVKCMTERTAEGTKDEDERGRLLLVSAHLDAAWVDADGGER